MSKSEVYCLIFPASRKEKINSKAIFGPLTWKKLIHNFKGFNTPAVKAAFDAAYKDKKNKMITLLVYEDLDGEMRHRGALVPFTENLEDMKNMINELSHDLNIEFEIQGEDLKC